VVKRGFRTCAECEDYPCDRLVRVLGIEEGVDSFISHKPALPNLDRIREVGSDTYLLEQEERRSLLERFMGRYNEGRSMSFYCRACALLPPEALRRILADAQRGSLGARGDDEDLRARAKAMRAGITEEARRLGIDLKLRAKGK
jgi:hypothetical protein